MSDIKRILSGINHLDTYQRVDSTHPLDLYVGIDDTARWTLLLISDFQPLSVTSSRMIMIKSGKRSDSKWTQSFSLVDDRFRDIFVLFCEDIVSSSTNIANKEKAVRFVGKRYRVAGNAGECPGKPSFPRGNQRPSGRNVLFEKLPCSAVWHRESSIILDRPQTATARLYP